jgi:hypothetical protein
MLGLAVTQRSIAAVEVAAAHGHRKITHAASFPMPEDETAQDPTLLGKVLRQFLKQNHFSASKCVIGLSARWLVAKEKSLPPTAADLVAGVLAIATEREFASGAEDLVFDYSGPVETAQGQSVLLVAAPHRIVDQFSATADAAGLKVLAVTSSMMSLALATAGRPSPRRLVLHLAPGGVELSVQSGGGLRLIRRLAIAVPPGSAAGDRPSADWMDELVGELSRVVALLPGAEARGQLPELLVWNDAGLSAGGLGELGDRLALAIRFCKFPTDLGFDEGPAAAVGEFAAAAALAASGLNGRALIADFLHSRLNPRKKIALKGKIPWIGGSAAVVLIVAGALFLDWQSQQQTIAELKSQIEKRKDDVAAAKDVVDKTTFARGWYDRRPKFLDGLREITMAFPAEGRIWATSLAVGEDRRALLSGKAADHGAVLEVLDRLNANPKFSDVKSLYTREVGGGTQEVSFAISLSFAKAEGS